jgi:cardiolipin synthase A/B
MPRPGGCFAERRSPSARRRLWPYLLLLLTGCQLTAARFGAGETSRSLVLTEQVTADSCVYVAHHPLRAGWEWLYEMADHLACLSQGALGKRCWLPLAGRPGPLAPHRDVLDGQVLEAELHGFAGTGLAPACVHLCPDGGEALACLVRLIDGATERLDVLMFEWEDDVIGRAVVERLQARASAGVRVRVLVDGGGNLIFGYPDDAPPEAINRAVTDLARPPQLEVRRTRDPFARFDHRKLVVADGRAAWTGGRNLVRRAFAEHRDLSFTLDGPLVAELAERFEAFWQEQGGDGSTVENRGSRIEDRGSRRTEDRGSKMGDQESRGLEPSASILDPRSSILDPQQPPGPPSAANCWARLLYTEPGDHLLQRALYRAVDRARHHVYVENVYFTDGRLLCKLAQARRRGADVRVVLTVHSETVSIDRANRVTANRLLRAGVRVYLYPGMTHAKVAAVDGCWAYVGTANFDPLSLRHNHEIGLAVGAGPVIEELEQCLFQPDFNPAWELHEPLPVTVADYVCEAVAALCL